MILDEIEENPNCGPSDMRRFRSTGTPRVVRQVRLFDKNPEGELYWVTGWQSDGANPTCPAKTILVEDSGDGTVCLLFGGDWGLRFKPLSPDEPWDLQNPRQRSEAFLLLSDPKDLID
jgi:hypothetical protein